MKRPQPNQRPHAGKADELPVNPDDPMAWVLNLERAARACRTPHIRLSRDRVVGMCILLRLFGSLLQQIDAGQHEAARKTLDGLLQQLDFTQPKQGGA